VKQRPVVVILKECIEPDGRTGGLGFCEAQDNFMVVEQRVSATHAASAFAEFSVGHFETEQEVVERETFSPAHGVRIALADDLFRDQSPVFLVMARTAKKSDAGSVVFLRVCEGRVEMVELDDGAPAHDAAVAAALPRRTPYCRGNVACQAVPVLHHPEL